MDADGAHIYLIMNPGTGECFDSIGYHAIGSGEPHATSSLIEDGYSCYSATLQEAMWGVFQAKRRAERAPGVGQAGDFAIIEPGHVVRFSETTLASLQELYNEVVGIKEECLGKLRPKFSSIPIPDEKP